jgi:hypothetical protein
MIRLTTRLTGTRRSNEINTNSRSRARSIHLPFSHLTSLRYGVPISITIVYLLLRINYHTILGSRDSDWLRAGRPRGRNSSPGRVKYFLFTLSRPALGSTQPPIQWVPGDLFPVIKRPGREADHSPPAGAEVKKMWIYTSTPQYVLMEYLII